MNGQSIPVTMDLNLQPLMLMGKPVLDGRGEKVMNDRWIYANGHAINVWRSKYCEKMYLSNVTIAESIGASKLMDADLNKFVAQVSDKLVFEKYGRWYRIFLERKTKRTFGIKKVVPYNLTIDCNRMIEGVHAHHICVDWKERFYVK